MKGSAISSVIDSREPMVSAHCRCGVSSPAGIPKANAFWGRWWIGRRVEAERELSRGWHGLTGESGAIHRAQLPLMFAGDDGYGIALAGVNDGEFFGRQSFLQFFGGPFGGGKVGIGDDDHAGLDG